MDIANKQGDKYKLLRPDPHTVAIAYTA